MNTKVNLQTVLIVLLLSILIFISTGTHVQGQIGVNDPLLSTNETGTGGAIEGTGIVPGGPGFIMISAFDWQPRLSSGEWEFYGGGLCNPSPDTTIYVTGLTLPHGANINQLTFYYKDNSSENMMFRFFKTFGDGLSDQIVAWTTSDSATAYRASPVGISGVTVDNQSFSYYLSVSIPHDSFSQLNLQVVNVRIDYGYASSLPLVTK